MAFYRGYLLRLIAHLGVLREETTRGQDVRQLLTPFVGPCSVARSLSRVCQIHVSIGLLSMANETKLLKASFVLLLPPFSSQCVKTKNEAKEKHVLSSKLCACMVDPHVVFFVVVLLRVYREHSASL